MTQQCVMIGDEIVIFVMQFTSKPT